MTVYSATPQRREGRLTRRLLQSAVAMAVVVAASMALASPAGAEVVWGPSTIAVRHSGHCLEVDHGYLTPGAGLLQWTCHGGQHQRWKINNLHNGYVQFIAEHSSQCLEVDNASFADGARVLQWPCHGGTHQQWQLIHAEGSFPYSWFQLRARHSGKCIEIDQASLATGARVLQWPCHGGTHQRWLLFGLW